MISIEKLLKNVIKHEEQGYSLFYYENGNVIEKVKGKESINKENLITFDSCFRLASVTKQFIAFGIVKLINDGLLEYSTNVLEIFPSLPNYFKNITIKHLLNHTSGIYDYEDMEHEEDGVQLQDDDIITFLKSTSKTYFEVGSTYKYSNTAYILLGLIIKEISKKSIGDYLDEIIFKKASMNNSCVNYEGITNIENRAYGHILKEGKLALKDQYWCSATIGDGGIYSNVNDLKKWVKYLVESLEFKTMRKRNYVSSTSYNEYCEGIRNIDVLGNEVFYHCGETIGTNTLVLFSIDFNICLIFLTNLNGIDTSIIKDNLVNYLKG